MPTQASSRLSLRRHLAQPQALVVCAVALLRVATLGANQRTRFDKLLHWTEKTCAAP